MVGTTLQSCGNNLLTCGNNFETCGNDLLTCGNELSTCGNELLTCGHNFISCGNEIKKMQGKQFYVPSRAPYECQIYCKLCLLNLAFKTKASFHNFFA